MIRTLWILLPALALSCTRETGTDDGDGSSSDPVSDDGSSSGGSSTSGGSSSGGSSTSSGGSDGDDGGGSSGGDCAAFENEDGDPTPTVIAVTNDREEPVLIGGLWSCDFALMNVEPGDASDDTHWPPRKCEVTCEELMADGSIGCTADCPIPPVIKIAPGGIYEMDWPGTLRVPADLPESCCDGDMCQGSCFVQRPAPEGAYRATVNVVTDVSCLDDPCDCTPAADGWCEIDDFAQVDPQAGQEASVEFEYPADRVALTLE